MPQEGVRLRNILSVAYDGRYVLAILVAILLHLELRQAAAQAEQAELRGTRVAATVSLYLQAMLDQEVGLRGFLATGDERFLEPYAEGQREEEAQSEALLSGLGPARERAEQPLAALRSEARRWREEIAAPQIAERRRGPLANLTAALSSGKRRFDALRTAAWKLQTVLAAAAAAEVEARELSLLRSRVVASFAVVLLLVFGFLVSRFVERVTSGPLTALAEAADRGQSFELASRTLHVRELSRLAAALESLRKRVADREALLASQRAEAEELRAFGEVAQQATGEAEVQRLLEQALRRALVPDRLQILSRDASLDRLEVVLPPLPPQEQARFPILLDPQKCRAVASSGGVALEATSTAACFCALGVPESGAYLCVPMMAAGEVIGLVNLQGPAGYASLDRQRVAEAYIAPAAAALSTIRLLQLARERALRDGLTQTYNRRFLDEIAPKLLSMALRNKRPVSVLMLDLDHFKTVNDGFGHEAGDRVLVGFTRAVQALIRTSDALVRYGGEEFVLILPDTDHEGALALAERIRAATPLAGAAPGVPAGLQVSVSIGVATLPQHGTGLEQVIQRADAAVYRAKSGGRDRVVSAEDEITPAG